MFKSMMIAFDIEVDRLVQGDQDYDNPPAITCLSLASAAQVRVDFPTMVNGNILDNLAERHLRQIISEFFDHSGQVLTWNGLGFDFRILAAVTGLWPECRRLARWHYDPMFQFFCLYGFTVGLNKVAKGFGLPGKPDGMDGREAARVWVEEPTRRAEVISYVVGDALTTLAVAQRIAESGIVRWESSAGEIREMELGELLTVDECLKMPEPPPPEWIRNPWARSKFAGWLEDEG